MKCFENLSLWVSLPGALPYILNFQFSITEKWVITATPSAGCVSTWFMGRRVVHIFLPQVESCNTCAHLLAYQAQNKIHERLSDAGMYALKAILSPSLLPGTRCQRSFVACRYQARRFREYQAIWLTCGWYVDTWAFVRTDMSSWLSSVCQRVRAFLCIASTF